MSSAPEFRKVKLQDIPSSSFSFACSEFAGLLRNSLEQSRDYYERFDWSKNPKQQQLYNLLLNPPSSRTQHILLRGSVGSGKTTAALAWAFENVLDKFPGSKWLVMRRTNMQLMASIKESISEFNRDFNIRCRIKVSKSSGPPEAEYLNTSKYVFWSSESAVESTTSDTARGLGGTQYSGATIEEADMVHMEAVDTIPQRLREKSGVQTRVIFYVANPTPEGHWLHKRFVKKSAVEVGNKDYHPEDYHEFKFTMEDNAYWLPPNYIEDMYSTYRHRPSLFRRMILGEWGPEIKGDPYFGAYFNRSLHISRTSFIERWHRDQLWKDGPVCLCWDFGFKRPCCFVFQDVSIGTFSQIRVLMVYLGDSTTLRVFGKHVLDKIYQTLPEAEFLTFCDPAGKQMDGRGVTEENAIDVLESLGLKPYYKKMEESYAVDLTIELLTTISNNQILGSQPDIIFEPLKEFTGDAVDMFEIGYCQDPGARHGEFKPYDDNYFIHIADSWRYGIIWRRKLKKPRNVQSTKGSAGDYPLPDRGYRQGSIREVVPGIYVPIPDEELYDGLNGGVVSYNL